MEIFGSEFIEVFKLKRPAGWVDLLLAFESRKRAATPFKSKPLNVSLPFSFTDYHQKYKVCYYSVLRETLFVLACIIQFCCIVSILFCCTTVFFS